MPLFHLNNPPCLFAHNPKTGGNSVRNVVFGGDYEGPWFGDELPPEWQGLFGFSFVRNPFDRLVSAWKMFTQGTVDDAWHLPRGGPLKLTLAETIRLGMDPSEPFGHPRYNGIQPTPRTRFKNHILPQSHGYHGLQHVEFIGRFENLQQDFRTIAERLRLPVRNLPKTNLTRRGHYREYFDAQCRRLATEFLAEDLERFGYEF
jgi:chondroitin 4-sulfotransferase 11